MPIGKLPRDPDVADTAPTDAGLTPYDIEHIITYLRVLDAVAEGADWREVSLIVLHIDPEVEPARAKRAHESHLARALWMTHTGYRHLIGALTEWNDPAVKHCTRCSPPPRRNGLVT